MADRGCVQAYGSDTGGNREGVDVELGGCVVQMRDTVVDLLRCLVRNVMGVEALVVTEDPLASEAPSVRESRDEWHPKRSVRGGRRHRGWVR